ncbi:MAG: hypothetical protein WA117_05970 [Verrucomicrobiia bacterium]
MPGFLHLFCFVFAVGFSVAALVAIKRSCGRLVGNRLVVGTVVLICMPFILLLIGSLFESPLDARVKKGKVAFLIQTLCQVSEAYWREYGHWPQPRNSEDLVLIFNGLRDPRTGEDIRDSRPDLHKQNPRHVQFMKFKLKDVTLHGRPQEELGLRDPWGTPYGFAYDNGNGGIYYLGPGTNSPVVWHDNKANDDTIPTPFEDSSTVSVIRKGCAFFSNGPDGRTGTGQSSSGGKNRAKACKDDIRSWR